MSFRIPVPVKEATPPPSRELAVRKPDGLHDAALHAEILGTDDKRVIWLRPAGPIKVRV